MAFNPIGVAAFPSPSILEVMFIIIAPIAALFDGIPLKSILITGLIKLEMLSTRPDLSATFRIPHQSIIPPKSPMPSSTEPLREVNITSESVSSLPPVAANATAMTII